MDMSEPRGYWSPLCNQVIDWDKNRKTEIFRTVELLCEMDQPALPLFQKKTQAAL